MQSLYRSHIVDGHVTRRAMIAMILCVSSAMFILFYAWIYGMFLG
jgi:hypothetical protein